MPVIMNTNFDKCMEHLNKKAILAMESIAESKIEEMAMDKIKEIAAQYNESKRLLVKASIGEDGTTSLKFRLLSNDEVVTTGRVLNLDDYRE